MDKCEFCGREIINGQCRHCDDARQEGEAFAREHGMPWDKPRVRRYVEELKISKAGWYD